MKKLLKTTHKTSKIISNLFYILLNIALAAMVIVTVDLFASPWVGLALVVISKWRVLAVKMRFWWANIVSNSTDLLVGISYVAIVYYFGETYLIYQIGTAVLYLIWLLLIKPGSSPRAIMTQGLIVTFVSNVVLSLYGYNLDVIFFLLIEMFIGYNVMQHYLTNCDFEIKYIKLMSGIWALVMKELAWICWHWMISYILLTIIRISQFAVISTVLTFLSYKALNFINDSTIISRRGLFIDLLASGVFTVLLVLVILLFFSKPITNL